MVRGRRAAVRARGLSRLPRPVPRRDHDGGLPVPPPLAVRRCDVRRRRVVLLGQLPPGRASWPSSRWRPGADGSRSSRSPWCRSSAARSSTRRSPTTPTTPGTRTLLLGVAFAVIAAAIGMYIGARRDLLASLQDRAERAEREQELQVARAQAEERTRIAREMHDVLAHRMSLVAMHAGALAYRDNLTPDETREAAEVIQANSHRALTDLREILGVLRETNPDAPDAHQAPPAADPVRPRRADRRRDRHRGEGQARQPAGAGGRGAPVDRPRGVPDHPRRAHQRPQACSQHRRPRDGVGGPGDRAQRGGPQSRPRRVGPSVGARRPGPGSGWSG